jgi:hypothetical protein
MIDHHSIYEELVYNVAAWNPLDGSSPDALYDDCQQFISTTHPLREYGITLKHHLLLKAGQQYRIDKKHSLGQLQRLCERSDNIAAQARWILARLYVSDMSIIKSKNEKWNYHKTACDLLSGIKTPVQFDVPILLPGIRSEISPDHLKADYNGLAEPKVNILPIPYRYLANFKLNLAYHENQVNPAKAISLILDAKSNCNASIQKYGNNFPFLSMNIDICNSDIDTVLILNGNTNISKTKVIDDYLRYIERIEEYIRTHQIPENKGREWQAACNAALAALHPAGNTNHNLHWDLYHQQVGDIVQKSKGHADFFAIDIIYQLANKTQEEKEAFKKNIVYTHPVCLTPNLYFEVLDHIINVGKGLEKFSRLKGKFDEETCRDYFIPCLKAAFTQFSVSAETYNNKGKTDILIADHAGNNVLIAECKLWKGEQYLMQAIDQLLGKYLIWRDDKAALIIFNNSALNFTKIIDIALNTLKSHGLCKVFTGLRNDTSYSFVFRHPSDEHKTLQLELILFNLA